MVYSSFRTGVAVRVILLTANIFIICSIANEESYRFSFYILLVLGIIQVINLIHYAEKTNRKLTRFLNSIRYSDFSTAFSDHGLGSSFKELNKAFNEVIEEFHKTRADKEEHSNYLQTVVQHVSTGILTFRRDGKVHLYNNAVKRLLRKPNILNINELSDVKKELPEIMLGMHSGDRELVKLYIEDEMMQVLLYATEFRLRDEEYVLIGLHNIHSELEEKEIESWQKLIRVLTHEIMNSMTPISSLASTVISMMEEEDSGEPRELDKEDRESVMGALQTIQSRSQALLNFVDVYRNLTRIPKPNFRHFPARELLDRALHLLQPKFTELGIKVQSRIIPDKLMITADPDLLDQVVINLLLNAIDAVRENDGPRIAIKVYANEHDKVIIEIGDNGHGIKPDLLDKIFMPFFTSKKHGSGIGLSLSRQIMHLHKGNITVKSVPGEGTVFTLVF